MLFQQQPISIPAVAVVVEKSRNKTSKLGCCPQRDIYVHTPISWRWDFLSMHFSAYFLCQVSTAVHVTTTQTALALLAGHHSLSMWTWRVARNLRITGWNAAQLCSWVLTHRAVTWAIVIWATVWPKTNWMAEWLTETYFSIHELLISMTTYSHIIPNTHIHIHDIYSVKGNCERSQLP